MELVGIVFRGEPALPEALSTLPVSLARVLRQVNGFIAFHGGLHLRGAVAVPEWHSLERAWTGEHSLSALYPGVSASDVPFAQDALGNQFLLRKGKVFRLDAETGEVRPMEIELPGFLAEAQRSPVEYLKMQPLLHYQHQEGGILEPGHLLMAYPPLFTEEAAQGVELKPLPAQELIPLHAEIARRLSTPP